nr:MAG TPA: hypothetical protein [Caudoviricetes sp.]
MQRCGAEPKDSTPQFRIYYRFFTLYASPHAHIASRIGRRLRPSSVRLYSTRGGTSA